ncbi:MAG: hypothetical protein V7L24_29980 [Nostoc sp.]
MTSAPNLGKFFTSCTKRPATAEDIALLQVGDWISERDCPWSWQFRNSCQDMAVGVWEGKEFFIPHHLLMVCEIIEGQVVEKFFKKPDSKFKVGDRVIAYKGKPAASAVIHDAKIENGRIQIIWDDVQDKSPRWFAVDVLRLEQELDKSTDLSSQKSTTSFSVGDRVKWRDAPESIYQVIEPERGGHVTIELIESSIKPKPPRRKRVALWEIQLVGKRPSIGTDLGFKVGDHIISKHPLSLGKIFVVKEYPDEDASGLLSFDYLVTNTNLVLHVDKVSLANEDSWNPANFGEVPHQIEASGQATIFYDANGEPPEPDDFETIEEFEEAWKQWENLHQGTFSQDLVATQKERSPQDTDQSGRSKTTPTPQPSTESDSQIPKSSNKTLPPLATNLSEICTVSISSLGAAHAQISALLENAPGLVELADNCFLSSSNVCKSSSLQLSCGNKFQQSYQVEKDSTLSKSLMRLQRWGMWGIGKYETEADTSPKTESDYSVWVFTGDIRATEPKPTKKSLQEIFSAVNSATGEEIEEAFTLTASTPKLGAGNKSHPNAFVSIPVKVYVDRVKEVQESPALCSGGWQHRSPLHRDKRGASFAVLYRAAGGDRIYTEESPTLRSLSSTGNHQSGSGAYKVREYEGETYLERPINATEAEQLMGWEVGSTARGINKEDEEFFISQTQRIKMLGNGIIPAEITDILTAIKPMLERKLESEVTENMRFAYRQLRQRGMSHNDALKTLSSS